MSKHIEVSDMTKKSTPPTTFGDMDHLLGMIYLPAEYVLPGEKRIKLKVGSREWKRRKRQAKLADKSKIDKSIERAHLRAKTQQRYYEKNREELNRSRAQRNKEPEYAFYRSKKKAEKDEVPWEFTLEEWAGLWERAPRVINPHNGFLVTAWALKGQYAQRHTQMVRVDTTKGWSVDNCAIAYKGEVICYGSDKAKLSDEVQDRPYSGDIDSYLDGAS